MRFAQFSKDSDDLSVTISMGEDYQKSGAKCSSGGNLEAKKSLHLKIEDKKCESQQKSFGIRKVNYKQQTTVHHSKKSLSQSSGHGLHPLA